MSPALMRMLALAWIVGACGVCFYLIVAYGLTLIDPMPGFDDWAFFDRMLEVANGQTSFLEIVFTRHNGHPSIPARLAFFALFETTHLDLRILRWGSILANMACAALCVLMLMRLARQEAATRFWQVDLLHPAMLIGVPVATALFLTNGHWEVYSVAMCFNNIVVNVGAIGAIVAMDAWLRKQSWIWLIIAVLMGALATLSMLHGFLVWAALALMPAVGSDRKQRLIVIGAMTALFVVTALWNLMGIGGAGAAKVVDDIKWTRLFAAPFVLMGTPIFGQIRNTAIAELDGFAGVIAVLCFGWGIWQLIHMDEAKRRQATPFLGLLIFGALGIGMVAWGRQMFPLPVIAAARYAEVAVPAVIGGFGVLCLSAPLSSISRQALAAIAAVTAVGWLITNQQEWGTVPSRSNNTKHMIELLRDPANAWTPEWLQQNFYLDPYGVVMVTRVLPWLKENRLSLYREKAPAAPPPG